MIDSADPPAKKTRSRKAPPPAVKGAEGAADDKADRNRPDPSDEGATVPATAPPTEPYRVLARKYRPKTFAELIGQDALVHTLSNAIAQGRVAQAFMLTGIRGVGKTTTARIIARALNCVGPDGGGGPTMAPCGVCPKCVAITEDRHVDVMEMDAASRTGVDDIRELIEGVRYRPVQARTKIYIIDEVHMLSKNAFNALLKTLEEPPEHVKFIFATTEIRKVPVTVLSRCQRFDLRRVEARTLVDHFAQVAAQEGATVEPAALAAIARAADGSVRDGLSILDQAIALAAGPVSEGQVREMLGLADRAKVFDILEHLLKGEAAPAVALLEDMHAAGADPALILHDLLTLSHAVTRMKVAPSASGEAVMPESERVRGRALADALSLGALTRAWSLLLKGLQDVQQAPDPQQAAEIVAIRMAYAATLPSPSEAMKVLTEGGFTAPGPLGPIDPQARSNGGSRPAGGADASQAVTQAGPTQTSRDPGTGPRATLVQVAGGASIAAATPATLPAAQSDRAGQPADFPALVALFESNREAQLAAMLRSGAHLVRFEPGRLDLRIAAGLPKDFVGRVSESLREWTGTRWIVTVSNEVGAPTLKAQEEAARAAEYEALKSNPAVRAVLESFPDAEIVAVRRHRPLDAAGTAATTNGDPAGWIDPEDATDPDDERGVLDFDALDSLENEDFE